MKNKLFCFTNIFKETLWGGHRILPFKGFESDSRTIGESWEISGIPENQSIVVGGFYDGLSLSQLIDKGGAQLLGNNNFTRFGNNFPLLVKYIDSAQSLSVQVHPNDTLAQSRHGCLGKNEMWYVVDCLNDAFLYCGFSCQITKDEYIARVQNNSIIDVLQRYQVKPGDFFYIPAGCVHSIGAGCLICEIQQSSDITYRIYDFDRLDNNGNPRQLHIHEAEDAISFNPQTSFHNKRFLINEPTLLVANTNFTTYAYRLTSSIVRNYENIDSFVVLICTQGSCCISCDDEVVQLPAGHSMLVSAEARYVDIVPEAETFILESFV